MRLIFRLHIAVMMLQWGNDHIRVDFATVRCKDHPHYWSENFLFRRMLVRFRRPPWAQTLVMVADAAYASKANLKPIRDRVAFFVIAFAQTSRFENGQALKDLVTHLPKKHYPGC